MNHLAYPEIVQEVIALAEAAGFRILDMGHWGLEVQGPLDSIAILVDLFWTEKEQAPRRYRQRRIRSNETISRASAQPQHQRGAP